jgi:hypothetical protein
MALPTGHHPTEEDHVKKFIAALAAVIAVSLAGVQPASAHQVGHVWCGTEGLCQLAYVDSAGDYWMARRNYDDGNPWVRLTLVAGWNNGHVAPITCENRGACVVVYYDAYQAPGYFMARRWNDYTGEHWVRLSDV